jgi:hypothetical protein
MVGTTQSRVSLFLNKFRPWASFHSYQVHPLIQPRLATLSKGDAAVLLVDEENKVTDVAFVPGGTK